MLRALTLCLLLITLPAFAGGEAFTLKRGSSTLEVELSSQYDSKARQALRDWLEHLSATLALAYGHWPRDRERRSKK